MHVKNLQTKKEKLRKLIGPNRLTIAKTVISRLYCFFKQPDKRLLEYKDKHKNERCFIVATGPSLTLSDLDKLKGEICFSMNSVIRLFDKTDWRPQYYVMCDPDVYESLGDEINSADLRTVFYNCFDILDFSREGIPYKGSSEYLIWTTSLYFRNKPVKIKFSRDVGKCIYSWHTTVGTILQLAVYMGFREIYLIGTDCSYSQEQKHGDGMDYKCTIPKNAGEQIINDYTLAKPLFEQLGVKVLNATRGGALEVFSRVDLDEVLAENNRS